MEANDAVRVGDVSVVRKGRVASVTFDRGTPANPLSLTLMRDLTNVARSFEDDAGTSAVVLSGRTDNFCMGFDLKDAETAALKDAPLTERRLALQVGRRMCRAWAELEALTIVAVPGWCVGGGVALAVSADLRIFGSDSVAYAPEIERGMNMSWGSVPRLVNLIGPARTKRLIVLAEKLGAETAEAWGLADAVDDDPLAAAADWAERAAKMPPVALRMCKRAVDAYAGALAEPASWADFDQFALAQTGNDFAEGVAALLEKREALFTGG